LLTGVRCVQRGEVLGGPPDEVLARLTQTAAAGALRSTAAMAACLEVRLGHWSSCQCSFCGPLPASAGSKPPPVWAGGAGPGQL
jgi:hypothetical protein